MSSGGCHSRKGQAGPASGNKLGEPYLGVPVPHRKFDSHALPHRCQHGAPGDAGESVQGTVDARLVTGEGMVTGKGMVMDEGEALGARLGDPGDMVAPP